MARFDSTRKTLALAGGDKVDYFSLAALESEGPEVSRLPFSLKVILESLLRLQDHPACSEEQVLSFARWTPDLEEREEYPWMPSRVLLQDFTGVPCVVDLAALRSALARAGHDAGKIEPRIPVDLIIDHSVQVDAAGSPEAMQINLEKEFERNRERYVFLRWGQAAFEKLRVLPPGLGICHQVNMEYLATCVTAREDGDGRMIAFPDTCVGTDSHTTTINSMGVVGWGVGGIEAEAAMLGQPIPILTPTVIGVRLTGELAPGATPTDLALTVTQRLRERGVVGCFIEYFGPGLESLSLADRAPVANMAPEYGATMGFFPVDDATIRYLRETGRAAGQVDLVERYCKEQGIFRTAETPDPACMDTLEIDMSAVEPSVSGPKRPHDRMFIRDLPASFTKALTAPPDEDGFGLSAEDAEEKAAPDGRRGMEHGSIIIAAITSCTNTSNPQLLLAAGLLARKAVARGLSVPPHVKTSFAPGSRVATEYLKRAGLLADLEKLGFHVVAYGCTTCIGNSGPLAPEVESAIRQNDLVVASVLSGNRNFEGRIHALSRANYLCSPPLVVAWALCGNIRTDLTTEPLGAGSDGQPVHLKDVWPSPEEVRELLEVAADPELYRACYGDVAGSMPMWNELPVEESAVYAWTEASTYIREPSFFEQLTPKPPAAADVEGASVLAVFGDFITTGHISPAGAIPADGPAGRFLIEQGVAPEDFNSFGSRRGNHEVMMRGAFANIRIRNRLVDREGGWTVHHPTGEEMAIYDAAMKYRNDGTPLVVFAGKLYGAGSSRDWAAKGTSLLGVRAVFAESFERIHRSNLVEMGVLPLEFLEGANVESLGLTGREKVTIRGLGDGLTPGKILEITAEGPDGARTFQARACIDTPIEAEYYRHGGILQYVLRRVMGEG